MSGDPSKASLWMEGDVYTGIMGTAVLPSSADTEMGTDWNLVGLLDGSDGFTNTQEWGQNDDHYAWGGILVRTSRSQFKFTKQFSALEDNATTRALIWPGSAAGQISVPKPQKIAICFEVREDDSVKRYATANYGVVTVNGDWTEGEDDLTKYQLAATIYPTGAGVLFNTQSGDGTSTT
jgi:hypothetical protein